MLLSILKAITLLGRNSHVSGGNSLPVNGDIFSTSKVYAKTGSVVDVVVVSSDFCLKIKKKSPHEPNYEATWLRAHSPPQRPTALSLPSPFALWPLFCPTKKKYIYISIGETYDDASRHVSIHHRAHRGTPSHETAAEEPQKRVFGYRSRARVYRDG